MDHFSGLTVDLSTLASNWHTLNSQLNSNTASAAVVKANAYGVGVEPVVRRLLQEGCKYFFVANLDEALEIKPLLGDEHSLLVLSGCREGDENIFLEQGIQPLIISSLMFKRWLAACKQQKQFKAACAVKVNTGMNRLGLQAGEWQELLQQAQDLNFAGVQWVMSHLACADEPEHTHNALQLRAFNKLVEQTKKVLPGCRYSLANSAGIFLGKDFHFDLVRPGIALYGGQPQNIERDLKPVVHLNLDVLQVRNVDAGESAGYGATITFDSARTLITVGAGYADGYLRALGNKSEACFKGVRFPQVGRVSMDSLIFDISVLSEAERPKEGDLIELLGANITVNELASKAGTISYEILTSLGHRYSRRYIN